MHIAQKHFEMHHSQLHVDLIAITTLMEYLDLHLEKSDSKRYLGVVFLTKKNRKSAKCFDLCIAWPRQGVRLKALVVENFLDTLNIQLRPLGKFLRASKVEEFSQKWSKSQVKSLNFELIFQK